MSRMFQNGFENLLALVLEHKDQASEITNKGKGAIMCENIRRIFRKTFFEVVSIMARKQNYP